MMIDQGRLSRHHLGVPDDDHDVDATALLILPKKKLWNLFRQRTSMGETNQNAQENV
jgi:hypothetical protein